jgi:hypothetical protein
MVTFLRKNRVKGCNFVTVKDMTVLTLKTSQYMNHGKVFLALLAFLILTGGSMVSAQRTNVPFEALSNRNQAIPVKAGEPVAVPKQTPKRNYTSFAETKYPTNTAFLYQINSAEYQRHPEFGLQPYGFPRQNMVEDLEKRTEKSRYFVDPADPKKFTIHQSYGAIHYRDANGWWVSIDPRLRPSDKEADVYHAPNQPAPTKIDLNKGFTSIQLSAKEELKFNQNVKIYAVKKDGSKELITVIETNPQNTTVGKDGAYSKNVLTGLDREMIFEEGRIKTNYILTQALPSLKGISNISYITFEEEVSVSHGAKLELGDIKKGGEYTQGKVLVKNQKNEVIAEWAEPLLYDHSEEDDYITRGAYQLKQENGKYIVVFAVDAKWLFSAKRKYPIILDPTVRQRTPYATQIKFKNNQTTNDSCFARFCTEETDSGYRLRTQLPPQAQITTVRFGITVTTIGTVLATTTRQEQMLFAFQGPCNRIPRPPFRGYWCGQRAINNPNLRLTCTTGEETDLEFVPYLMDSAGICLESSCKPSDVPFYLETYGCGCGNGVGCSADCYFIEPNKWIMFVDGETVSGRVQSTAGVSDTLLVCTGESITFNANAAYGVGPYQYRWTEDVTGKTGNQQEFSVEGFEANKIYKVELTYGDQCRQDLKETFFLKANAGADVDLKITKPSCPDATNGKIESTVLFQNEAKNNATSGGCPLTKQIEAQIGSGTTVAVERSPYRGGVNKNRLLFLLKPDEIKQANPEADGGKIASIAFFVTKKVSTTAYENFTIKMGIAASANLTAARLPSIKMDTVFGPTNYLVKQGWNVHDLGPGFSWDGKSNIVVDVCYDNRFPVGGNDEVEVHPVTGAVQNNPTLYTSSNAVNLKKSMCGNNTPADLTTSPQRPNVRLGFCKGYELRPGNVQNMTGTFENLARGEYTVLFVDPVGCSFKKTVKLDADSLKYKNTVLQHEFCGKPNGKIRVDITKGNPPFTITVLKPNGQTETINDVQTKSYVIENLSSGWYDITITDAFGCQAYLEDNSNPIEILPDGIFVTFTYKQIAEDTCAMGKGAVEITIDNKAVPPFSVEITPPDNIPIVDVWMQRKEVITDLNAGKYLIRISDGNGCIMNPEPQEFEVAPYTNFPEATVTKSNGPQCPTTTDGEIEIQLDKGVPPYRVDVLRNNVSMLANASVTANPYRLTGLMDGKYDLTFRDAFGCTTKVTVDLNAAEPFTIVKGYQQHFCLNTATSIRVGDPGDKPAGGTWICKTNPALIADSATGEIDLTQVGNGGIFEVYYQRGICESNKVEVFITKVDVGADPPEFCSSASEYVPTGFSPSGGVWTSEPVLGANLDPVSGRVNLNYNVPAGRYRLIYTVSLLDNQKCSDDLILTVNEEPKPFYGYEIYRCLNDATLAPLAHTNDIPPSNEGEWICKTIPALFTNPSGGVLDKSLLSDGQDVEVFYRSTITGCESKPITLKIRRTNVGNNPPPLCPEGTFTPNPATPIGGRWSSTDISGINPTTGEVSLAGLSKGDYKLVYTMNYGNGVNAVTCPETLTITVKEKPVVGGAPNRVYCKGRDGNTVDLSNPNDRPQGGIWVNADNLVTEQGVFNLDQAPQGIHNVYYVYESCSSQVVTVRVGDVQISGSPNPVACEADASFPLPTATPAGGAWSSSDNRVVISNGAVILGNTLPAGRYKLVYQQVAGDPNSCKAEIELSVKQSPKLSGQNPVICITPDNMNVPYNLTNERPVNINGGTWSNGPGHSLIQNGILGTINLSDPAIQAGQNYPVTYTSPAPDNCELKFNLVFSKMNAGDDLPNVCENVKSVMPKNFSPADKFWFAEDNRVLINPNTGAITLDRTLPAGEYKIFYVEDLQNKATACKDELKLTVIPAPKAEFDVPPYPSNQLYFMMGSDPVNIISKNKSPEWSYLWEMGDGTTYNTENVSHIYRKKGEYTIKLKITHQNTCEDETTHTVTVEEPLEFSLPLVFTPNNDGINDELIVPVVADYDIKLHISDRFGNKVFIYPEDGNKWKPQNDVAPGVYFYVMEITKKSNGKKLIKSGNITILR